MVRDGRDLREDTVSGDRAGTRDDPADARSGATSSSAESIRTRLERVRRRIAEAAARASRRPEEVQVVAVTKSVPVPRIREALEAGLAVFGESRVQEARAKVSLLGSTGIEWHLVGHLQTNKSRPAAELFDLIHSVDSIRLARALERHGSELNRRIRVLVQVNLGEEASKAGVSEDDVLPFLQACRDLPHIAVEGLMVIPPFFPDPQEARPFFRRLRELRDRAGSVCPELPLRHLSMGMSHDFEVAVEEGATLVRIGTAIFGPRSESIGARRA
jgi:hypothetical protein